MARPRKDSPPDLFTSTDLAVAAGLSLRNIGLLQDRALAPKPRSGSTGKGGNRFYDTAGIALVSLTGAIHACGVELLLAARLAASLDDELGARYGAFPSNLNAYLEQRKLNRNYPRYPWEMPGENIKIAGDVRDDFWLHHLLRTFSEKTEYRPRETLPGDFFVEIVDRQYVFFGWNTGIKTQSPFSNEAYEMESAYRISGWERGEATVRSIAHEIPAEWADGVDAARLIGEQIEKEFDHARKNATGVLRINASLAVRNGLDAIHDHRLKAGAAFDWNATAKPLPGKYAGCDAAGRPLDPNHPWNMNLPPHERAARLEEIENYIAERDRKYADQRQKGGT